MRTTRLTSACASGDACPEPPPKTSHRTSTRITTGERAKARIHSLGNFFRICSPFHTHARPRRRASAAAVLPPPDAVILQRHLVVLAERIAFPVFGAKDA